MTAKQYLSQAYRLNERINSDLSELDRLRDLAISLSSVNYDGIRVSSTRSPLRRPSAKSSTRRRR